MLVKVATCKDVFEAEVVKGMLSANGIDCCLQNENMSQIYGGIPAFAVNVLVREEDVDKTRELLDSRAEAKDSEDGTSQLPSKSIKRILLESLLFTFFLGVFLFLISWLAYGIKLDIKYACGAVGIFLTYFLINYFHYHRAPKKEK